MARVKETKVATRGEDPKKAPKASKTARKVPPHHEEATAATSGSSSNSDGSSGSESESIAEKKKNKNKSAEKPKGSKVNKSEPNSPPVLDDSSDDSSDDDESEGDVAKALKKAKADKKAAPSVKSSKKSGTPAAVSTNGKVTKAASETTSDESSGDGEEDDSASSPARDDAADSDEEMADAPAAAPARPAPAPVDPTRAIAPQPFDAPSGFKSLDTKAHTSRTLSSLLSASSSKQIWHITAPSSVPLNHISSISLAAIQSQTPVLTYKSTSYAFAEEKESKTTKKVLIPGEKGYAATDLPVSRSLVLQQVISLPNLPAFEESEKTKDNSATPVLQRGKRDPRPQPKGLRMRYRPLGHVAGEPGAVQGVDESEDENVDTAPTFRAPKGGQSEKEKEKERKRKRDGDAAGATPRSEKKRRKEKEVKKTGTDEGLEKNTLEVLPGQEELVKRIEEKVVEGTQEEVPQTEEEKARKKAEKREKRKSKEGKVGKK